MTVRVVLFDLGNVLVRVEPDRFFQQLAAEAKRPVAEVRKIRIDSGMLEAFELGDLSSRDAFDRFTAAAGPAWSFEQFARAWNAMLSEDPVTPELLSRLQPRYQLAVLSNTNILHDEYIRRTWPSFSHIHRWFMSYQLRLRKPDPKIYEVVLRELEVEPHEVAYVDDMPEHIESARRLGIHGIHLTPGLKLEQELAGVGVHV